MIRRVAVLVSGEGSNLQALLDHPVVGPAVVLVVADRPGTGAVRRAQAAGVETVELPAVGQERAAWDGALARALGERHIGLVVLAGLRRLLGPAFVEAHRERVVNVHPSLLPAFPGLHAVRDALAAGVWETGVTVQLVDEGMDTGPVLAQQAVAVLPDDDVRTLHARLQTVEHRLLPDVVARLLAAPPQPTPIDPE